jgi:uncharacterized membrane protein (GlpM family)
MLRSLPELLIMIKGIVTATTAVSYALGLLMLVDYVFAIAMVQLSRETEMGDEFFRSVPLAMYSLIIYGTFLDDLSYFADRVKAESTVVLALGSVFVILASLTVMNMLIGVLCEVISAVAEEERESMIVEKVHDKFGAIVKKLDTNENDMISWVEFRSLIVMPEAQAALESVDVDPLGMIDFASDHFFDDEGNERQLSFDEFMEMLLDMRGGQEATLKDIMVLGKKVNKKILEVKLRCLAVDEKLDQLLNRGANPVKRLRNSC